MQLRKHLVTASYINDSMSLLDEKARSAGITILGEMGLDPGIGSLNLFFWFILMANAIERWARYGII